MNISFARTLGIACLVASMSLLSSGLAHGADPAVVDLPGITSPDPYPDGCVSCHKGAMLLKAKLQALDHRNIDSETAVIPNDCKTCHKAGEGLDPISNIAHSMHYASGSKSEFVTKHKGSCLNCHQVATGSGEVTVKSGKRNW
jgi:hypothetical protein